MFKKIVVFSLLVVAMVISTACQPAEQEAAPVEEAVELKELETTIYYRDVFRSYLPEPGSVATDIQAQLAELGIKANIEVMESGAFIEESNAGRLDGIYLLGWNADYPHITNFLDFHFAASNPQWGNPFAEVYEPLGKAAQIADPAEAEPLYVEANNALKELVPMIPVAHGGSATVFQADVQGAHASPLGNEYFAVMDPGGRDTFVWMQNAEPISVYCNDETDGESLRACEQVLESLLSYEVGGTAVKAGLATSCDPNDDLTEWTCNLRDGVKFHDGSDLDANDVVMSWAVAWDGTSPLHVGNTGAFSYFTYLWTDLLSEDFPPVYSVVESDGYEGMVVSAPDCEYGGLIKEIAAVDSKTVKFTMCVPDPAFPTKAAFSAFSIQPKEWIESAMASHEILEKPVGTGPYVLDTWSRGDSVIFKKFEDYWGEPAKAETLVFRWATEGAQRKLELESGTVDGIDNPSPDDFDALKANDALTFYSRPALNIFYIAFTNTFEPFDDARVRKAIALGIDRQRIVDNFYPKGSEVATHFTPCVVANGCVGEAWYDFDLVAAKALLAEAGFGK